MKSLPKGKKVFLLFLLVCLFFNAGYSQIPAQDENGDESDSLAKKQELVDEALDNITIEIAKEYFVSKGDKFPSQISKAAELQEFLVRSFPEEGHELRQAVSNLQLYKKTPNFTDVRDYLKKGVQEYAVDLNGKPFDLDDKKIDAILNNTDRKLRQVSAHTRKIEISDKNDDFEGFVIFLFDLLKENYFWPLILIFLILAFPLIMFFVKRTEEDGPFITIRNDGSPPSVPDILIPENQTQPPPASVKEPISSPASVAALVPSPVLGTAQEVSPEPELTFIDEDNWSSSNGAPDHWLIVKASVAGKSHLENNPPIPCQDSNYYQNLGQDWGIAIVCDGAGSKKFSHIGSAFVAKCAGANFIKIVRENEWQQNNIMPAPADWHSVSKKAFAKTRGELEKAAAEKNVKADLFGCTIIVVIHSQIGILTSHIGDGRAAFCNFENEWKAIIKPHKGEEANQTVFITSVDWNDQDSYIESQVIEERPAAFALMSDGCETYSFEVNIYDEVEQRYKDPNRPFPKFFEPVVNTLKNFHRQQLTPEEIDRKWINFLENGNEKLKNEQDDKTMIVGVLLEPSKN